MREDITLYCERCATKLGSTQAIRPANRVKFHWPPHPVSYEYHVLKTDWTQKSTFVRDNESFEIEVAVTPYGVFGRSQELWCEARGIDTESMLSEFSRVVEPLFQRLEAISRALESSERMKEDWKQTSPFDLLRLLFCEDRDVAHCAHEYIEISHYRKKYLPSLCAILLDRKHPMRRSAQWCVLDLFEDLPSFISSAEEEQLAIDAMKQLLWDAEDDFARTVYKAGVVLGGHLPHRFGGEALLDCLSAPSAIGRRSAVHGLFHVCEWVPQMEDRVVHALREHAKSELNPQLSIFSYAIANDIESRGYDHTPEPIFEFEKLS